MQDLQFSRSLVILCNAIDSGLYTQESDFYVNLKIFLLRTATYELHVVHAFMHYHRTVQSNLLLVVAKA